MLQSEASECGLVCLAFASARLGAYHELTSLRQRFPVSSRGLNLKQLTEIATGLDMVSRGVKCELDELSSLKSPSILHWGLNHFVVLLKVKKSGIINHDPAIGKCTITFKEASDWSTGYGIQGR